MPRTKTNVLVSSKECHGNHERMIRRFLKKTKRERVVEEAKDRRHYKKPSVRKREAQAKAARQRAKDELKKQRAEERRNRSDR